MYRICVPVHNVRTYSIIYFAVSWIFTLENKHFSVAISIHYIVIKTCFSGCYIALQGKIPTTQMGEWIIDAALGKEN